jgi:hypothetical protein
MVVGRSAGVRQVDAQQVVQAQADMEKPISDGYHYYHFVSSVLHPNEATHDKPATSERTASPNPPVVASPLLRPDTPPAEGESLRVIPVGAARPRPPSPLRSRQRVARRGSWFRRFWT